MGGILDLRSLVVAALVAGKHLDAVDHAMHLRPLTEGTRPVIGRSGYLRTASSHRCCEQSKYMPPLSC
jgi:hypothetical protein